MKEKKDNINAKRGTYLNINNPDCSVSKASNEIMLSRISEGSELEFPFKTSLNRN